MKERGNFWLRFMDRYIGIPVLCFLSLFKRSNKPGKEIRSVLIIKIGTIGDTLLLMPVLKAIKDAYHNVSMTVICSRNNYEVLSRYSFIDSSKVFEASKAIKSPSYLSRFIKDINTKKYDAIIDFEPWPRISALLAFFVKNGYRIGFRTMGEYKHLLFDGAVPHNPLCHEMENYISLAKVIGISVDDRHVEFPISDAEKAFVEDLLKTKKIPCNNLILFHPWSSGYKGHLKEWSAENFTNLAKLLVGDGYFIGITGAKDNQASSENIVKACHENVVSFSGELTLGQTAYLIQKSRLLIAVNTGIMHLGAALNHPMIALHGPAGVLRWGGVGSSNVHNIESSMVCAPCLNLGFEYKCRYGGCMNEIKVETVARKAEEILSNRIKKIPLYLYNSNEVI